MFYFLEKRLIILQYHFVFGCSLFYSFILYKKNFFVKNIQWSMTVFKYFAVLYLKKRLKTAYNKPKRQQYAAFLLN